MADPLTWQVVGVIAAALSPINGTSPYHTTMGARVDTELRQYTDADTFPRVAVAETDYDIKSRTTSAISAEQVVVCEAYVVAKRSSSEKLAHKARADLVRALARIPSTAFADIPASVGVVNSFEIGPDCKILRRVDGLDFVVVQVAVKVFCIEYA